MDTASSSNVEIVNWCPAMEKQFLYIVVCNCCSATCNVLFYKYVSDAKILKKH